MLFTTPTHWAALGITLIAGWFFGLASSSGGKKWKRQLEEAEVAYAEGRDRDERELREAKARIRELEAQLKAAGGSSVPALAAGAVVGAGAATLAHSGKDDSTVSEDGGSWIPEGPPPPPLAMGTPEPAPQPTMQPIAADAAPAPAAVQEEVSPASTETNFPAAALPASASAAEGGAPEAASSTSGAAQPATATADGMSETGEGERNHEWLPPHVRASEPES